MKNTLRAQLHATLCQRPDLAAVKVADGARDNWSYLDALAPEGTAVVNIYHAAEQLKASLDARYVKNDTTGRTQFDKLRHVLREDTNGVEKVIRALADQRKKHPPKKRLGEAFGHFRRNRHRMSYAHTKVRHLPIDLGVVAPTCKTLVTQRLKRSDMRWRHAGGQSILTLRALVQSQRFDTSWALLSNTYRRQVTIIDSVVVFPVSVPRNLPISEQHPNEKLSCHADP